jgi:hypothetical protein
VRRTIFDVIAGLPLRGDCSLGGTFSMSNYLIIAVSVVVIVAVIIFAVWSQRKRAAAWQKFAADIGGDYMQGGLFRAASIRVSAGQTMVTIDTHTVSSGESSTTYTRLRTPFESQDGLQFTIQRQGVIGRLGKSLGLKHLDVGDPDFDRDFLVQGNNEYRIQSLLLDQALRGELQQQKSLDMNARNHELRLEVRGLITDIDQLKALYKLFQDVLDRLQRTA